MENTPVLVLWIISSSILPARCVQLISVGVLLGDDVDNKMTSDIKKQLEDSAANNAAASMRSRADIDVQFTFYYLTLTPASPAVISRSVGAFISHSPVDVVMSLLRCDVVTSPVYELFHTLSVPVVLMVGPCSRHVPVQSHMISVIAPQPNYHEAVAEIFAMQGWNKAVVFNDQDYEVDLSQNVNAALWDNQVTLTTTGCSNLTFIKDNRYILGSHRAFVLLCPPKYTANLLIKSRFSDLDLLGPHYHWFIIDSRLDIGLAGLADLLLEGDNVAVLKPTSVKHNLKMSTLNGTLWSLYKTAQRMIRAGSWTPTSRNCTHTTHNSSHFTEDFTSEFAKEVPSFGHLALLDVTSYDPSRRSNFRRVADWTPNSGVEKKGVLFPQEVNGLNRRTFPVTALPWYPYSIKDENGTWSGICFEIVNELARIFNFSYDVIEPPDDKWGIQEGNNTQFNGMIGMIQRKEVHFGIGHFSVNQGRQNVVDFSPAFQVDTYVIVLRKPSLSHFSRFLCFGPFDELVWSLVCLSALVVGVTYWFIVTFHPLYKPPPQGHIRELPMSLWQIFGALLQQGMVRLPAFTSGRVLMSSWWFYTLVVVGTYNGNLIAFLTMPRVEIEIHSISDLAASQMNFGFTRFTALHSKFKEDNFSTEFTTLWNRIKDQQDLYLMDSDKDGLLKVLKRYDYAFILEKSSFESLIKTDETLAPHRCEFSRGEQEFSLIFSAFPFQQGSPYLEKMSVGMLRMLEAGLVKRWERKWSRSDSTKCTGLDRTTEQNNIMLAETQGAFYILGIGILLASCVLMLEKFLLNKLKSRPVCLMFINQTDFPSLGLHTGPMIPSRDTNNSNGRMNTETDSSIISDNSFILCVPPSTCNSGSSNFLQPVTSTQGISPAIQNSLRRSSHFFQRKRCYLTRRAHSAPAKISEYVKFQ